ncbi:MAG TPA: anti-sigma factor [Rhodanobacteraceae bacterium]|nr:anti-sigma factor [Rhodanobacteraceae bacterium]
MNTSFDQDREDLRYAEYVLGVLDADARAEVAREIAGSDEAATAVALWQQRLLPLAAEIAAEEVPPYLWSRIRSALQWDDVPAPSARATGMGLWQNLRFWQRIAFGASALAAACLLLLLVQRFVLMPPKPVIPYMAATITQTDGRVGWTATMDIAKASMIIVPASPQSFAPGHAPELWLIPKGEKPIAVGMIVPDAPTTLDLDKALLARLGPTATLAVSIEPPGGSPTGQPTGPVIATGTIGAAGPSGQPVALLWNAAAARDRA